MNDARSNVPHFLRVARALAKVSGVALPVATVITSVVAGTSTGCSDGVAACAAREGCGDGSGGGTTTATASNVSGGGFYVMDGGYDGGPVGDMVMPDAGDDGQ